MKYNLVSKECLCKKRQKTFKCRISEGTRLRIGCSRSRARAYQQALENAPKVLSSPSELLQIYVIFERLLPFHVVRSTSSTFSLAYGASVLSQISNMCQQLSASYNFCKIQIAILKFTKILFFLNITSGKNDKVLIFLLCSCIFYKV